MNFFKTNLWELDRSPLLNHFGAILSLLHIANYVYWRSHGHFMNTEAAKPLLCWGFFSHCASIHWLSHGSASLLFSAYLVLACIAFLSFLLRRFVGISWTFLLLTCLIEIFFYISDASLRLDIHALLIFLNLTFLFVPNKASLVRVSVIAFYLVSGYRELSPEWLSGYGLHELMPLSFKALEWVAAVGIIIKFTLPFLLISTEGQRLALGVCGLIAYHAFHFYFEHNFESIAMILLNIFLVLDFFSRARLERESMYQSYAHPEPTKLWWPIVMVLFLLAQTNLGRKPWPTEIFRIVGPARVFECQQINFAKYKNRVEQIEDLLPQDLTADLKCHPVVAFNGAKEACVKLKDQAGFETLTSYFITRQLADKDYHTVFSLNNVCAPEVTYESTGVGR